MRDRKACMPAREGERLGKLLRDCMKRRRGKVLGVVSCCVAAKRGQAGIAKGSGSVSCYVTAKGDIV